MPKPQKRPRAGVTEKISISLDRSTVSLLRRRAKRLYGGNVSAAVAEGIHRIEEEEGRQALVAWLGPAGKSTPQQREATLAEWGVAPSAKRTRRHHAR